MTSHRLNLAQVLNQGASGTPRLADCFDRDATTGGRPAIRLEQLQPPTHRLWGLRRGLTPRRRRFRCRPR
jgi:hypothetical protein